MQKSPTTKAIVLVAGLVVMMGFALKFFHPARSESGAPPVNRTSPSTPAAERFRRVAAPTPAPEAPQPAIEFDWRSVFTGTNPPPPLPREAVEKYLSWHRRSAESLLAAFHNARLAVGPDEDVINDPPRGLDFLKEAATNFPNNPKVQLAVLANMAFPKERRKWLDAFKAAAPDNSLANYLSAQQYFEAGQTDAAVAELLEAARKPEFRNYAMESRLDEEQLNLEVGRSEAQSWMSAAGWAVDCVHELAMSKRLAQDMASLQQQYLSDGDTDSAERLAQRGMVLAGQLSNDEGGKFLGSRMTGIALESIALQFLDPNTSYDFLGSRTPAQVLAQNKETLAAIRALAYIRKEMLFTLTEAEMLPTLTEAEVLNYAQRQKIFGELEALRWLQLQRGTPAVGGE